MRLSLDLLASEQAFADHVERLAHRAASTWGDATHRLLVFPENLGLFLPLIWAPDSARTKATVEEALAVVASRRALDIARSMAAARTLSPRRALLLALSPPVDRLVREVFSSVARRHRAHVVAGSHLVAVHGKALSNTSYAFDPRGDLVATTHKVNLVPGMEDDLPGGLDLTPGHPGGLPVVSAPVGEAGHAHLLRRFLPSP